MQITPYEDIYGRQCLSLIVLFEVGESRFIGPYLVHQDIEKVKVIQEKLNTMQSRQRSYNDVRRRDLEFTVDDWVYLKLSHMKGVMRYGKEGKLSPQNIVSYKISKRISNLAYELEIIK